MSRVLNAQHSAWPEQAFRPLVVAALCGTLFLFGLPPINWLPPAEDIRNFLGVLLGAQASITALSLAVMVFVLQGVNARPDADDGIYREYVKRSYVRDVFAVSVTTVGVTGASLFSVQRSGTGLLLASSATNLVLVAAAAFLLNLLATLFLFERTLTLLQPGQWRRLKQSVNERRVKLAVASFIRRLRRIASDPANPENFAEAFRRETDEESANQAVAAILDEALRAMDDHRSVDVVTSLRSITDLIGYAMAEIEAADITWGVPGSRASWPPLEEIHHRRYLFGEAVLRRSDREFALELRRFNSWLVREATRHNCGELLTVGMDAFVWDYEIACRDASATIREFVVDSIWTALRGGTIDVAPREADGRQTDEQAERSYPYIRQLVRVLERLMDASLRAGRPADFRAFREGFAGVLRHTDFLWGARDWPSTERSAFHDELEQSYRVALMGLGGRAIVLADRGDIPDAAPFLEIVREVLSEPRQLAADMAFVFDDDHEDLFLWDAWETENAGDLEVRSIDATSYPLTFFTVRMQELATGPGSLPDLELHGHAARVLDWFTNNAARLQRHAK